MLNKNFLTVTAITACLLSLQCASPSGGQTVNEAAGSPTNTATFSPPVREHYEATGHEFIIASQGPATTKAAQDMFKKGGNVIDAAAAASFAIAVERPQSTGIAGGGFMVIHLKDGNKDIAVDFRERAPLSATETMYQDPKTGELIKGKSTDGAYAVGVPGMVAGVLSVHKRYGKLPLATILQPAIELAEKGVVVYPHLANAIKTKAALLSQSADGKKMFFDDKGQPLAVGATMRQPNLAKVLRQIAKDGQKGFYTGWVAKALVNAVGGVVTQADLDAYQVVDRKPVSDSYGPYEILSMPPPSSGGVHIVEILNILEGFPLPKQGAYSAETIHQTAAAMQLAYFDRSKYLGDSDFVDVPLKGLTSDAYAAELRKTIAPDKAKTFREVGAPNPAKYESPETTHFSIADKDGNVVTSTQTINGWFGSGIVVPGAGMVLNNQMDDFSAKPGVPNNFGVIGGTANAIKAKKRPLSSMSPTIVKRDGKPVLALGSPSGSQIITCVTLTILNHLSYEMPLYDAVTSIRYHHQWTPDELIVEKPGFQPDVTEKLTKLGYTVKPTDMGCKVQAIAFENQGLRGVSDPRGEGLAASETPIPASALSKPGTGSTAQD